MRFTGLVALLGVVGFGLSGKAVFAQQTGERVVVTAAAAQLKAQSTVIGTVPKGVILTVKDVNGEWLWVVYTSGKATSKGWIARRDVVTFDRAAGIIDAELQRAPQAELYNIRGTIRYEKGEYDLALADCNEALRLDPGRAHYWNNRGNIWRAKGDTVKAIADFNQAVRIDPDYQAAYKNRGNVWSDRGAFDKAVTDYTEALRLDPKDADACNNRGSMWMQQGQYDKAIADWNQAMTLDSTSPLPCNNLAWLLASCPDRKYRDGKRAVELATRACELGGWKNAGDIDTLATAYSETGDLENAVKWQTKAIELAPEPKKAGYRKTLEQYRSASVDREEEQK